MGWLGSWFLTFGGVILRLAGTIFDTLIWYVIVAFGTTLKELSITPAIDVGWKVLRDLANILIIGMFTFIAIGTILGLEKFGAKKAIAQVLIVAVLINFSLIFAKLIIDGSNFASYVVYRQVAGAQTNGSFKFDIASAFLLPMGITSVWSDTAKATEKVGKESNSGFTAFFFGLVGGFVLLAVAGVLLYGCFLIAARAILFIFLMLTGPLAFATYLHPDLAESEYGWSNWWKSLINTAIFGPLLMILLAISLIIIRAAGNQTGVDTTLGAVIANPETQLAGSGWVTILVYLIGIGLLFVSFRMAGKFAGSISGFKIGALPLLGALGIASSIYGQARGRYQYGRAKSYEKKADEERKGAAQENLNSQIHLQDKNYDAARKAQERSFDRMSEAAKYAMKAASAGAKANSGTNVLDTKLAKMIKDDLGIKGFGESGKDSKGYADKIKEKAEHAAKIGEGLAISSEQQAAIRKEAESFAESQREAGRATLDAVRQSAVDLKNAVENGAHPRKMEIEAQIAVKQRDAREAQMRGETDKIAKATKEAQELSKQLRNLPIQVADASGNIRSMSLNEAEQQLLVATEELRRFNKQSSAVIRKAGNDALERAQETVHHGVEHIARHEAGVWGRMTGADTYVSKEAVKKLKGNIGKAKVKKILEDVADTERPPVAPDAGGTPSAPAH